MVGLSYRIQLNVSNLNLDRMISQSIHFWNRKYILFFFCFVFFRFFLMRPMRVSLRRANVAQIKLLP